MTESSSFRFAKMHGLGNDFMVVDNINQSVPLSADNIRKWADRRTGIGFDQLLVVESSYSEDCDFAYRIFNADGGEVAQCGNGARCFVQFVNEQGLSDKSELLVETLKGKLTLTRTDAGEVTVNMGVPDFEPETIPLAAQSRQKEYEVVVDGQPYRFAGLSMGNPHAVLQVENVDSAPVLTLGPKLECHSYFPQHANIGFMQIVSRDRILLRVFERGAGETLACGSGACAAVVAGIQLGLLDKAVQVGVLGGVLQISWQGEGTPVYKTGPATTVFQGNITTI